VGTPTPGFSERIRGRLCVGRERGGPWGRGKVKYLHEINRGSIEKRRKEKRNNIKNIVLCLSIFQEGREKGSTEKRRRGKGYVSRQSQCASQERGEKNRNPYSQS